MTNISPHVLNILAFLRRNKLLILALALVLFFLLILFLSASSPSENIKPTNGTTPSGNATTPRTQNLPTQSQVTGLNPAITWSPVRFSERTLNGVDFNKTQLPEGETKYSFPSSTPNRPNEIIVKDGVIIYQRAIVTDKYIYNYTNSLGAADYNYQSSRFYGSNTQTYVYLKEGTAFVADADTTLVKEQLTFEPVTLEEFKQKYAEDIADFTIVPTLSELEEEFALPNQ